MLKEAKRKDDPTTNAAISAWQRVLGAESIFTDQHTVSYYENTTFKTDSSVIAVLMPETAEEVQECVRIANEHKTPLYPVSRGNNWGYGSRVPVKGGCAVISLEKMNNITELNEEMGYITVEPGVTFGQAYEYLKERNSELIAPAIGSTRDASLIGNALERGIGKGVYGDRFQHCCNMEVVLPNGEVINTGFGNIENASSKNLYRWGVGPSIDGIFSQSNFGIVTKMTFWLTKKPEYFQTIFYTIKNNEQLAAVVDALRQLRLEGTITTTSTLSNSHRILSMQQQFPHKEINNDNAALPQEYVDRLQKQALNGAVWIGDDAILAPTKTIGKARAKRVKQVLGKAADKIIIIDNTKAKIMNFVSGPVKAITGVDLKGLLYFFHNSFYLGKPMEKQLAIAYWRKKTPVPEKIDLDRDRCGVITPSISVPFEGKHVLKVLGIIEGIFEKYALEPNLGLNFVTERSLLFVPQILYDRDVDGHDIKAMECYKEMRDTLLKEGYPPYRLGIQSMDKMLSTSKEYVEFINKLKQAIDPNNIISPNHYGIK